MALQILFCQTRSPRKKTLYIYICVSIIYIYRYIYIYIIFIITQVLGKEGFDKLMKYIRCYRLISYLRVNHLLANHLQHDDKIQLDIQVFLGRVVGSTYALNGGIGPSNLVLSCCISYQAHLLQTNPLKNPFPMHHCGFCQIWLCLTKASLVQMLLASSVQAK